MNPIFDSLPSIPESERFIDIAFDISERIIRLLEERGLSQRDFAQRLQKKDSEISKWLRGNHNFTLRTIASIETVFGCNIVKIEGLDDSFQIPAMPYEEIPAGHVAEEAKNLHSELLSQQALNTLGNTEVLERKATRFNVEGRAAKIKFISAEEYV